VAWETSDRRLRLPPNWNALVKQVKERDGGRCTWKLPSGARCPRVGTDVDHRNNDDNHDLRNLQLLCRHHHDKKTQREAWSGRQKAKKGRVRREEKHPGYNRH
jgi:5-methylcytosine-specific restriction endonuclease McrA